MKVELLCKNKNKLYFTLKREDDFLSMLDKFLKKNKITLNELLSLSIDCDSQDLSISCKIAKSAIKAINLSIKSN